MSPHALYVLEFDEALTLVAGFAASPLGAKAVRALTPGTDAEAVRAELAAVEEVLALLRRDERWAPPPIPDARAALERLRIEGSVLEGPQLLSLAVLLASSRTARRAVLAASADAFPLLALLVGGLPTRERDEAVLTATLGDAGAVRDEASPELYRLRREMRGARGRLVERLSAVAVSLPAHLQVPDGSVSVREGRYVIPVRREGRGEVGGIVHDESATGATLFVEPPLAVELMNRLREMEAREAREVLRILRELTDRLRPLHGELSEALRALTRLDSLYARARYALRADAHRPEILPAGTQEYQVVRGVHPLLQMRAADAVVPFDLRMDVPERTLLISGPNTGGKTVLLKAVGLISLLAQSGVIPPVAAGSRLPIFRDVFADIGDEQSIEASLSTFSAHLKNLGEALRGAGHESLVLTDEIGSGTDPVEGAALARAVLLEMSARGAFTVATTHLGQLKLLATESAAVVNASLQFDAERLQPTYRLVKGMPGRSYGLAIARRLGLPEPVLATAEAALPQGERDVARLLLDLETKEQRLDAERAELAALRAEAASLREHLEHGEAELRHREKDAERRARQQARDLLLEARAEVDAAIAEVRAAAAAAASTETDEAARAARRRVEQAAARQRSRTPGGAPAARARSGDLPLEPGVRVRIGSLNRTGTVLELRDGKAMVEAGSLRLLLPRDDLTPLPSGDQAPARQAAPPAGGRYVHDADAHPEVDLRGLRVDELETRLGRELDAAILANLPSFRIIHGKGTGALRERVAELLRADPRVLAFRAGEHYEGGTGVTVVEFG